MSALPTAPMKILFASLLALIIIPAPARLRADAGDAIDRFVAAEMAEQQIPGVAVAIVRGGTVMKGARVRIRQRRA